MLTHGNSHTGLGRSTERGWWRGLVAVALGMLTCAATPLLEAQGQGDAPARAAKGRGEARAADREAIAALVASVGQAFRARNAEALAGNWTEEGEYENDAGVVVRGRESLTRAFSQFFAKTPEITAEMKPESMRFLGRDAAIGEGSVTVRKGPASPATKARFSATIVREEGQWKLASLIEFEAGGPTIGDLDWIIGEWRASGPEGVEIHTTYTWSPTRKFIFADFTAKERDLALAGRQVIGIDPATGKFRSWTFEADGGVGEADWTPDGDHWVLEVSGTLADGRSLVETNILRRINDDTMTFQSVRRTLGDADLPDLPPIKVTRVKAKN